METVGTTLTCSSRDPHRCPTEIAAAGEATFYVALDLLNKKIALSETWSERPQRICLEMWNSHGEYRSNNVPSEILALAPPEQS
jgi:hypothetical protein